VITHTVSGDEEDRDVERRGTSYLNRRDFVILVAIVVIVVILAYVFIFRRWKDDRDFAVSKSNLAEMSQALALYAGANNDGLPPVYLAGVSDEGRPFTWANQIFGYIGRPEVFGSDATPEGGATLLTRFSPSGEASVVSLSYGMLSSADTARRYEIRDETVILAESVGNGAEGSYNPLPLGGPDGFMIGYDNSNGYPTSATRYVTRLGFIGEGDAPLALRPLHGKGTLGIRADGSVVVFKSASDAFRVSKQGKNPSGRWVPF
jgi:hypothetical protein